MRLYTAQVGDKAFDHFGDLTPTQAHVLKADGFAGCFTYVNGLTAEQLQIRLDAGFWVAFVLEGLARSTMPTRELGGKMATNASALLRSLGVPQGVCVFSDLETESGLGGPTGWKNFGWGAADATLAAGDVSGAYVAEGIGLSSSELMAMPVRRYWKGAARVTDASGQLAEPSRGWCCIQALPIDYAHSSGVRIDYDLLTQDRLGGNVIGVVA